MWENHMTNWKISKTCILQHPIMQIYVGMAPFLRATDIFQIILTLFQSCRFGLTWWWVNDDRCYIFGWTNLFRQIQPLSLLIPVALLFTLRDGADLRKTYCWPPPWLRTITVCVHVCVHTCVLVMTWGCKFLQSCPVWAVCKSFSLFLSLALSHLLDGSPVLSQGFLSQRALLQKEGLLLFTGLGWSAWEGGIKSRKMGGEEGEIR